MLRSGLRVEEVAKLSLEALDLNRGRVHVHHGKGGKDRVVYISPDTHRALTEYLQLRPRVKAKQVFLVEKGPYTGKPLSVRGIQKRLEYYARKARVTVVLPSPAAHHGHPTVKCRCGLGHHPGSPGAHLITTTQRYCKVSNLKVKRDYYKAMEVVMHRTLPE